MISSERSSNDTNPYLVLYLNEYNKVRYQGKNVYELD